MITTGIRTPVGVKVMGPKLETIQTIGLQVEKVLQGVQGTRSAFFELASGHGSIEAHSTPIAAKGRLLGNAKGRADALTNPRK